MTDFYSQNRCVCSTRSYGPLLCAFCLSFHFKGYEMDNTVLLKTSKENDLGVTVSAVWNVVEFPPERGTSY